MRERFCAVPILAALLFVAGCYAPTAGSPIPSFDGARLYREHCASCHGKSGAGDGPLAGHLNVAAADLRLLSSRNEGIFPTLAVVSQIDGRDSLPAHGSREMPVWGWQFSQVDNDKRDPVKLAGARIDALVEYLTEIQITSPDRVRRAPERAARSP